MATTENIPTLKINYLTQAQYDTALANNQINSNELYFTPQLPLVRWGISLPASGDFEGQLFVLTTEDL